MGAGVPQDLAEGGRLIGLATEQGFPEAMTILGICCGATIGNKRDPKQALAMWRLGVSQGMALGQVQLGLCYLRGTGVEKNIEKAVDLFRSAAEQGNAHGQYHLATFYHSGEEREGGVPRNLEEAASLYRLAADQGHAEAQLALKTLVELGLGGVPKFVQENILPVVQSLVPRMTVAFSLSLPGGFS